DAGPDPHRIGGLGSGPFPADPVTVYGSAQGLLEAPISASVDEGENLWVVTQAALYLLQPGAKVFRRYTEQDGLHYGPGFTPPPLPLMDDTHDERHWYADHVHPWVCIGGPCTPDRVPTFGDWFGLTLAADGRLWMGGLTTAGAINYREKLEDWILSFGSFNPFSPAFEWPPIFVPPAMGDPVNIRGVAVTPNGVV